jgi:hypothetical protein
MLFTINLFWIQCFVGSIGIKGDRSKALCASSGPVDKGGFERSHFRVQCCSQSIYSGSNALSVQLALKEIAPRLYSVDVLGRALEVLADVWDPDWLVVWDLQTRLTPEQLPARPEFGWINYIAKRTGLIPKELPNGWVRSTLESERQIIVHQDGPPDKDNPRHHQTFKEMFEAIKWSPLVAQKEPGKLLN